MNVVIVHYHLNRGGVARVIANHAAAVDSAVGPGERLRIVVMHGGRREGWTRAALTRSRNIDSSIEVCPTLDYDDGSGVSCRVRRDLPERLAELDLSPHETVIHVHNHALGKNLGLPDAVHSLAKSGYGLLLQIHDFVEDYRPANYRRVAQTFGPEPWKRLYPVGPRIHYGVLNPRDWGILKAAGVPETHLHLIPNPVLPFESVPSRPAARERLETLFRVNRDVAFLLYPVRCIRRKNIGEALLLSVLAPGKTVVGFTLAPLNPAERAFYEPWRTAAEARRLPCRFEVGGSDAMTFAEAMAAADGTITTSVAEGFGMAFLEGWQLGLPLAGRDLPEITSGLISQGVSVGNLYSRLDLPLQWIDREVLRNKLEKGFRKVLRAYGIRPSVGLLGELHSKWSGESIDFGDLDEQLQLRLIDLLHHDAARRDDLYAMNPALDRALRTNRDVPDAVIAENARIAAEAFGKESLGRRLVSLYRTIAADGFSSRIETLPQGERILESFLTPRRFRLLMA